MVFVKTVAVASLTFLLAFVPGAAAVTPEQAREIASLASPEAPCVRLEKNIGYIFSYGGSSFRIVLWIIQDKDDQRAPPNGRLQITRWTERIQNQISVARKHPDEFIPEVSDLGLTGRNYDPRVQQQYDDMVDELLELKAQCGNPPPPTPTSTLAANG